MSENENTIECFCRKYRVQTPGGLIVEVESTKALSGQITHKLLEEDTEIDSFFSNHKIVGLRQLVTTPAKYQEDKFVSRLAPKKGRFTPRQRLNHLLKMKGEFTREDYQKYMLEMYGVKIEKFMAYDDIRSALASKRLEVMEGKSGRQSKYRITDPNDVDENLYKSMIKDQKIQMGVIQ